MTAIQQGIVDLINAFVKEAKRHGFSIMLMLVLCLLFGWRLLWAEDKCEQKIEAFEKRMEATIAIYTDALNDSRRDWLNCDSLRQMQALQITELRIELRHLQSKQKAL